MNNNTINEIRQKVDIVDIIGDYIPLIQKGKNFFGVCPFHDDTNPSMSVSREKQIYRCFSCGASGNVFTFLMNYNHYDFKEAVKELGEKTGVNVSGIRINKAPNKNDKYYEMYDIANKYYQNNINTKQGAAARKYLKNRKINNEIIKEFEIGLSLSEMDNLTKILLDKNFSMKELDAFGLSINNHDTFINRITFPLYDPEGHIVGFSGRIYDNSNLNKYMNTKETPIFKKGSCLYNYHRARDYARQKKYIIIVEGFMDAIRVSQIGFKNVIALMGTALTEEQISLIKKLSNNIYLSLDGDQPGVNATLSNGEQLIKAGLNVKVITLPDKDKEHDPDEYIIKYGEERYKNLIETALNFSDFKINYLKRGVNFSSDLELSNYINSVIAEASTINDEIRREIILKNLAKDTNISYNTLEKRLNEYLEFRKVTNEKKEVPKKVEKKNKLTKYDKAAYNLIYSMLNNTKVIKLFESNKVYLMTKELRSLASEICYYYQKYGNINMADFYTYLNDKEELRTIYDYIISLNLEDDITEKAIMDYVEVIKEYRVRQEIERLNELIKQENDPIEKAKIAEKIRLLRIGD